MESKEYVVLKSMKCSRFEINKEGLSYAENGMPEFKILKFLDSQEGKKAEKKEV